MLLSAARTSKQRILALTDAGDFQYRRTLQFIVVELNRLSHVRGAHYTMLNLASTLSVGPFLLFTIFI